MTQLRRTGPRRPLRGVAALLPLLAVLAVLSPQAQASAPLQGPDVSKYQHPGNKALDWGAIKRAGQSFAFIKATGGSDRTDPWFAREWAAAGKAGMIRGAYHYADPSRSADEQAAHVVSVVGSTREANDLGIALDLESTGGLGAGQLSSWAHTFLAGVEKRTGRVPILYTYANFWHNEMRDNRTFGAYPLWLARYDDKAPDTLPGWDRWTFWQHTSSYHLPGVPNRVDHNQMCCSLATLQALADGRSVAITQAWRELGGASGALGLPLGVEVPIPGGWGQEFEHGYLAQTATGVVSVLGPIWARYRQDGGATGPLGPPVAASEDLAAGVTQQRFQAGRILYSEATGAHSLEGVWLARWLADGADKSEEGLPTVEPDHGQQQFTTGGLYLTDAGVRMVPGAIRDKYEEQGGPASTYGLPASDAHDVPGGRAVDFQSGSLYELVVAGQRVVI